MSASRDLPLVSGRKRNKNTKPMTPNKEYNQKAPCLVMVSVRVRNVNETKRLKNQLKAVVIE